MIHEEICTYEVAKLAKENGFDGSGCLKHYDQNGLLRSNRSFSRFDLTIDELYKHDAPSEVQVYAPTQSLLQRWLREEKKVEVHARHFEATNNFPHHFGVIITDGKGKTLEIGGKMFDTYELALEDALKYALENLV